LQLRYEILKCWGSKSWWQRVYLLPNTVYATPLDLLTWSSPTIATTPYQILSITLRICWSLFSTATPSVCKLNEESCLFWNVEKLMKIQFNWMGRGLSIGMTKRRTTKRIAIKNLVHSLRLGTFDIGNTTPRIRFSAGVVRGLRFRFYHQLCQKRIL